MNVSRLSLAIAMINPAVELLQTLLYFKPGHLNRRKRPSSRQIWMDSLESRRWKESKTPVRLEEQCAGFGGQECEFTESDEKPSPIWCISVSIHLAPIVASRPLCTSLSTTSGLKISRRNLSCCRSSKALSVGPGYNRNLVYSGVAKYSRYLR